MPDHIVPLLSHELEVHLFLPLLPLGILLLHVSDHEVESLSVLDILLLLPLPPRFIALHLPPEFLPYDRGPLFGLPAAQEPLVSVACGVFGVGERAIVVAEREPRGEGPLH